MNFSLFSLIVGLIVAFIAARADLRRRKLSLARTLRRGILATLDLVSFSILAGVLTVLVLTAAGEDTLVLRSPLMWAILACAGVTPFIWAEGYRQIQLQRPDGIVLGELLILGGLTRFSNRQPQLIVETGTFIGHSAIKMAEGPKADGFGRIITIEHDPRASPRLRSALMLPGSPSGSSIATNRV